MPWLRAFVRPLWAVSHRQALPRTGAAGTSDKRGPQPGLPNICPAWLGFCSSPGIPVRAKEFVPPLSESTNLSMGRARAALGSFSLPQLNFQKIGCLLQFRNAAEETQLRSCCEKSVEGTLLSLCSGDTVGNTPQTGPRALLGGAGGGTGAQRGWKGGSSRTWVAGQ